MNGNEKVCGEEQIWGRRLTFERVRFAKLISYPDGDTEQEVGHVSLEFRREPQAIHWGIVDVPVDIYRWYLKL